MDTLFSWLMYIIPSVRHYFTVLMPFYCAMARIGSLSKEQLSNPMSILFWSGFVWLFSTWSLHGASEQCFQTNFLNKLDTCRIFPKFIWEGWSGHLNYSISNCLSCFSNYFPNNLLFLFSFLWTFTDNFE